MDEWVSWGEYEFAHAEDITVSSEDSFDGFVFSGVVRNGRYLICPLKFSIGEPQRCKSHLRRFGMGAFRHYCHSCWNFYES